MPEPSERICAVVVTYNRKALLAGCLAALLRQTRPPEAILVVDNASTDGTRAWLRQAHPAVALLALEENRGGAGGFAAGIEWAAGQAFDWIWVMDDDVEPAPDALAQLLAPGLHRRPETVALASQKRSADGRVQARHSGWYVPVLMRHFPVRRPAQPGILRIGTSSFVGLMVRGEAVRAVGVPCADFFIFHDDAEYCVRLRQAGRLYLVERSVVVHREGGAPPGRPLRRYWRNYYLLRNRILTMRRHVRHPAARLVGYGAGCYYWLRGALAVLARDDHKRLRLRLLGRAFLDGVRGRGGRRVDPAAFGREAAGTREAE